VSAVHFGEVRTPNWPAPTAAAPGDGTPRVILALQPSAAARSRRRTGAGLVSECGRCRSPARRARQHAQNAGASVSRRGTQPGHTSVAEGAAPQAGHHQADGSEAGRRAVPIRAQPAGAANRAGLSVRDLAARAGIANGYVPMMKGEPTRAAQPCGPPAACAGPRDDRVRAAQSPAVSARARRDPT
jgi:hypothetical protein